MVNLWRQKQRVREIDRFEITVYANARKAWFLPARHLRDAGKPLVRTDTQQ